MKPDIFSPDYPVSLEVPHVAEWLRNDGKIGEWSGLRLFKCIRPGVGEVSWERAVNEVTNVRFADDGLGNRVLEDGTWIKLNGNR